MRKTASSITCSVVLTTLQVRALHQLWNAEYPSALTHDEVEGLTSYLQGLDAPQHYLVQEHDTMLAWAVSFDRAGGRWFVVIVAASAQGRGWGTSLMRRLQTEHNQLNGWIVANDNFLKQDGSPYRSPQEFYRTLGFVVAEEEVEQNGLQLHQIYWQAVPF